MCNVADAAAVGSLGQQCVHPALLQPVAGPTVAAAGRQSADVGLSSAAVAA